MNITIENVGKIRHADITIDGITVIAGENGSGKSTVGKALYAAFNSLHNSDEKIVHMRKRALKTKSELPAASTCALGARCPRFLMRLFPTLPQQSSMTTLMLTLLSINCESSLINA